MVEMSKFDECLESWPAARMGEAAVKEACSFLNMHQSAILTALTQAAEIERGDKVVVDRYPREQVLDDAYRCDCVDVAKLRRAYEIFVTASEEK